MAVRQPEPTYVHTAGPSIGDLGLSRPTVEQPEYLYYLATGRWPCDCDTVCVCVDADPDWVPPSAAELADRTPASEPAPAPAPAPQRVNERRRQLHGPELDYLIEHDLDRLRDAIARLREDLARDPFNPTEGAQPCRTTT